MRIKHFLFAILTALCLVTAWAQPFDADIRQTADYKQGATWVPVLLRDNAAGYRTNLFAPNTPLVFGTNGQVVANTGTNVLTFTNSIDFTTNAASETRSNLGLGAFRCPSGWAELLSGDGQVFASFENAVTLYREIIFDGDVAGMARTNSRANLGFSTNLNTLWTATNSSTARSAVGLGATWLTNTNLTNFKKDIGLFGSGSNSVLIGGISNSANSPNSVVVGGVGNSASISAAVVGGVGNSASTEDFIGGGTYNTANSGHGVIAGGTGNSISDFGASIVGGANNYVDGQYSTIGGGAGNTNIGLFSIIGGGLDNAVSGWYCVILGGASNSASGSYSTAGGYRAKATNDGSFVWADNTDVDFGSTNENSVNIRAIGGMSLDLGTNGIIFRTNASAATTRTNLGLGGGITTNRTFVAGGVTNSVTISNGIITGWTQ